MMPAYMTEIDSETKRKISSDYTKFINKVDGISASRQDIEKAIQVTTDRFLELWGEPHFRGYQTASGMTPYQIKTQILDNAGLELYAKDINRGLRAIIWPMLFGPLGFIGTLRNSGETAYEWSMNRVGKKPRRSEMRKYIQAANWFYERLGDLADGA